MLERRSIQFETTLYRTIRKTHPPNAMRDGRRLFEKIMLHQDARAPIDSI
jgi:hypothetical protein